MIKNNKLRKNIIICSIILLTIIISIVALVKFLNSRQYIGVFFYPKPEWNTTLSEEEHYQNIVMRTEEYIEGIKVYNEEISYEVYLVYSFEDNPEYFLVEFVSSHLNLDGDKEKFHVLGMIVNDEYFIRYTIGRESIYKRAEVLEKKLYYHWDYYNHISDIYAYENNGEIFEINNINKSNYEPLKYLSTYPKLVKYCNIHVG